MTNYEEFIGLINGINEFLNDKHNLDRNDIWTGNLSIRRTRTRL